MEVQVKDKKFVEFISKKQLHDIVCNLAQEVEDKMKDKDPLYIVMLNGAFVFASDFLRSLKKPCETVFVKYSSYDGLSTTGIVKKSTIPESVKGRNVVILEDIVDSGLTMDVFMKEIKTLNPNSVTLVSLLSKPACIKTDVKIDHIGKEIDDAFVVGYGLDYDGFGRNLDAIYVLKNNN